MRQLYAAIDLKSFYASVECVDRGLDPLTALLVVADESRTEKTICLAVSPALKQYGLPGRCRLFEVTEKAREVRAKTGKELTYIVAPPRMKRYMDCSAQIYKKVYLKYFSPEDIHVYSIDEVFVNLSPYLKLNNLDAHAFVLRLIREILAETGITATAGIGTNLYLAKVAMDIVAKHLEADRDGVRIAELDEMSYREKLWAYRPLTRFWRVGNGIAKHLEKMGVFTMGDLARRSLSAPDSLFKEFGIDAELLIDHAWGEESCTIADIKAFQPRRSSVSVGQVLPGPYPFEQAKTALREMADGLSLELVKRGLLADAVMLTAVYEKTDETKKDAIERYGSIIPRPVNGALPLVDAAGERLFTSSSTVLMDAAAQLFEETVNPEHPVRRLYLVFEADTKDTALRREKQLDMFSDADAEARSLAEREREETIQKALLQIKGRFGQNAILRGMNYQEGATARERNAQIGGHAAGEKL